MKLTGMYTLAGAQLAARAQAAESGLTVTRAAAGSGDTLPDQLALTREMQGLVLQGKSAQGQNVTVAAMLTAGDASEAYLLKEVGLYARIGQEEEVLYKLFTLDERLTVEPDTDLTVTFYLTETILQADQVRVEVSAQGAVTQEQCLQTAQQAASVVQAELTNHKNDGDAHSGLFAQKAPLSHSHGAGQITGGTLGGQVSAQSNTNYTAAQLRNIVLSTAEPSGGSDGDVWFRYSA